MRVTEIDIPEPCAEDWDQMTPRERGRFCASCQQKVHDLSAMTREQARELLAQDGEMCVSYLSRGDEVLFAPAKVVPLTRLTRRRLPPIAAAGLTLALTACTPHGEGPSLDTQQHETPALLEYTPSFPVQTEVPPGQEDVEPCEPTLVEKADKIHRTAGARLQVRPEHPPVPAPAVRTKGAPTSWNPREEL